MPSVLLLGLTSGLKKFIRLRKLLASSLILPNIY